MRSLLFFCLAFSAAALAPIPDEISATDAAPLLCAGITTFNSLRNSGARTGDIVAILGLGGLGHLGVQFAAQMGFETVAIARGKEKELFAKKLGAKHYLDSESQNVAAELEKLGGAKVILSTVTSGKAVNMVVGGMGLRMAFVLAGGLVLYFSVPYFQGQAAFWVWVIVVYPVALALDVVLMVAGRPTAKA